MFCNALQQIVYRILYHESVGLPQIDLREHRQVFVEAELRKIVFWHFSDVAHIVHFVE